MLAISFRLDDASGMPRPRLISMPTASECAALPVSQDYYGIRADDLRDVFGECFLLRFQ